MEYSIYKACNSNTTDRFIPFHVFQEGKYKQASVQYKKIVSWLEHESGLSEEDEKKAKALRLAAHLNLAMCFLKLQEPNQTLENCDKVSDNYSSCHVATVCCPTFSIWRLVCSGRSVFIFILSEDLSNVICMLDYSTVIPDYLHGLVLRTFL